MESYLYTAVNNEGKKSTGREAGGGRRASLLAFK